ncbi:hypothetical protein PHISCL_07583 [Aspergillus sclerotialis]|uniref:Uncharacterized protein n=1 Tax=Aspergillus sclerotialis TaxID=2070753 RepID=A0A3A2ZAC1_9EURO|nr:hypothetical protein PHISCL_07583 [Aspergillus sclerotialis]
MELTSPEGGFRSNRSYPSLKHISLSPTTSRFPSDDDDPQDYHSGRDDSSEDLYYQKAANSRFIQGFTHNRVFINDPRHFVIRHVAQQVLGI